MLIAATKCSVPNSGRFKQTGVTMLEVLISVVIVSIGILGVISLQLNSLRVFKQNYDEVKSWQISDSLYAYVRPQMASLTTSTATAAAGSGTGLLFQQIKSEVPSLNKLSISVNSGYVALLLRLDTGLEVNSQNAASSGCPDGELDSAAQVYRCIYFLVQAPASVI